LNFRILYEKFSQLNITICMKVGGEAFSFIEKEPKGHDV